MGSFVPDGPEGEPGSELLRELEELLPPELAKAVADPTQSDPGTIQAAFFTLASYSFKGPVPHPRILADYGRCVDGGAERVLQMAEKQATHRQEMERLEVAGGVARVRRGQWFGFIVAVLGLGAAAAGMLTGHSTAGIVSLVIALTPLLGAFLRGGGTSSEPVAPIDEDGGVAEEADAAAGRVAREATT